MTLLPTCSCIRLGGLGLLLSQTWISAAVAAESGFASKWALSQKPDTCVIQAPIGGSRRQQTLGLAISGMFDGATLSIGGNTSIGELNNPIEVDVVLMPTALEFTSSAMLSIEPDTRKRIFTAWDLPEAFIDQARAATILLVKRKGKTRFQVQLEIPETAISALRACNDTWLKAWGLDPSLYASLKQKPDMMSGEQLVGPNDYPSVALDSGQQGTTGVRYTIDIDGRAKDCVVIKSSGFKALDAQTCKSVLSRGRFRPALDRHGSPIPVPAVTHITWSLGY